MSSNPEKPAGHLQRYASVLLATLAVLGGYMLVRAGVYRWYPINSLESWFGRDVLMCLPRLLALGALLLLNQRWHLCTLDLPWKDWRRAALAGLVPLGLWAFFLGGGSGERFTPAMMVTGLLTSLVVGFFEEYAFRGVMLSACLKRFSPFVSAVLSSALFTVYHFQAQPVPYWLILFLSGLVFAHLRMRGLGLGWLAIIHGLIDASYFWFRSDSPAPFGFHGMVLHAGLLVFAVLTWPRPADTGHTAAGPDNPFTTRAANL